MANDKKYSGLDKKSVEIPPYSTATIEYNETLPNYYRVQNRGTNRIFCGTSHMPTEDRYDFVVGGEKVKLYGEPFNRNNLYILNPSGSTVGVTVVSFAAEFDPTTLALADLELDFSASSLETSTVITGFNSALPTGSNNIGSVKVSNFPSDYAKAANQKDYTTILESLVNYLADLLKDKNKFNDDTGAFNVTNASDDTAICGGGACIIHVLTNDGDTNIDLVLGGTSNTQTFTLKSGESIQDFKFIGSIKVTGDSYSFRALVSYPF